MQRILTAMGTIDLNEKLKNVKDFSVFENDIQYREGIIDVLKEDCNFDILIIYEKLCGEIEFEKLIKKIKLINSKIKIIFIFEDKNKNENLKNILINENIKNIFYNDEINFDEFIFKLKNLKFSEEEFLKNKINKLNKIILEKNNELIKYKKLNNKLILIIGENNKLKKIFLNNLILILKNKKIKIINNKINNFKKIKKNNDYIFVNAENAEDFEDYNLIKKYEKIIFLINSNFEEIKKYKKIIDKINNKNKINILINQENINSINFYLVKNIFPEINLIKKIKIKNKINNRNKKIIKKIIN